MHHHPTIGQCGAVRDRVFGQWKMDKAILQETAGEELRMCLSHDLVKDLIR
jgi:hypothetical protein